MAGSSGKISQLDLKQGHVGDCYFLAGLGAEARTNPAALAELIEDHKDGTYTVTLNLIGASGKREPVHIGVSARFPEGGASADHHALWPMLFEKAFAKYLGGYEAIEGCYPDDVDGLGMVTGRSSTLLHISDFTEDSLLQRLSEALAQKVPVRIDARTDIDTPDLQERADKYGVILCHAYWLDSVAPAARTISLKNPWGHQHLDQASVKVIMAFFNQVWFGAQ